MRPRKTTFDNPIRCENCRHYHQHYVLWESRKDSRFMKCGCGHCTSGRVAKKTTWFLVCDEFAAREKQPPPLPPLVRGTVTEGD